MNRSKWDAIVVGSGPNGLAAAIELAKAKLAVLVLEASDTVGGGTRSKELTLPGFVHDVCSAVHPMALASPFLKTLPLADYGLHWIHPTYPCAHPLDDGTAAVLEQSLEATAERLDRDGSAYRRLFAPLVSTATGLFEDLLGPLRIPKRPFAALRFGLRAIRSCYGLAQSYFRAEPARALIAGLGAHSVLPLEQSPSAAIAVMLGLAGHVVGWPIPRGGSQQIANSLAAYLQSLGGVIQTGAPRKMLSLIWQPANEIVTWEKAVCGTIGMVTDARVEVSRVTASPPANDTDATESTPDIDALATLMAEIENVCPVNSPAPESTRWKPPALALSVES